MKYVVVLACDAGHEWEKDALHGDAVYVTVYEMCPTCDGDWKMLRLRTTEETPVAFRAMEHA